ncbi:hypothetical protein PVK62_02300 [Aliivibrio sp. S3MY1]|uniref:hypothetical protein n=1 Tax=unclassified Aliivibrio TaxID=2645654 RepID=UPI002377F530|nr:MULTISPECIES: hypothetical protein [unclassified Aliivibrio]MDD9194665.1 hypothetical protein [Aliivibrio sp. S3MY1]MDD9198495.1 hypothetical protein [Aliivibrio sp. S2MY1]
MDNVAIALHQLNRAIDLYFNEHDFVSTITLSSAAQAFFVKRLLAESQVKACEDVIFNSKAILMTERLDQKMNLYASMSTEDTKEEWESKATQLLMYCCDSILTLNLPRSKQVILFLRSKSKNTYLVSTIKSVYMNLSLMRATS